MGFLEASMERQFPVTRVHTPLQKGELVPKASVSERVVLSATTGVINRVSTVLENLTSVVHAKVELHLA